MRQGVCEVLFCRSEEYVVFYKTKPNLNFPLERQIKLFLNFELYPSIALLHKVFDQKAEITRNNSSSVTIILKTSVAV